MLVLAQAALWECVWRGYSLSLHVWHQSDTLTNRMDVEHGHSGCVCLLFLFITPLLTSIPSLSRFIPFTYLFLSPVLDTISAVDSTSLTQTGEGGKKVALVSVELNAVRRGSEVLFVLLQRLCKRSDLCWRNQLLHGYAPQMSLYQWRRGNIKKKVCTQKWRSEIALFSRDFIFKILKFWLHDAIIGKPQDSYSTAQGKGCI